MGINFEYNTCPVAPIDNPGSWMGEDILKSDNWLTMWSREAIAEISEANKKIRRINKSAPQFKKHDFHIPNTELEIQLILDDLENGKGFSVLRGLSISDVGRNDIESLFWGIVNHFGTPISQNSKGECLGHVTDLGLDANDNKVRNYQTSAEPFFHNDACDILALMCLKPAKTGGKSRLASIPDLFNAMFKQDESLTRELFRPYAFDRRGEPGRFDEDQKPYYLLPVFSYYAGYLSARLTPRSYIHSAQTYNDVPRMSKRMGMALDLMEEIVVRPDISFSFEMEAGDIQLVNNYCVFHSRTEYEDFKELNQKRHLLRSWLSVPNSRILPPWFKSKWGAVAQGKIRGGIAASIKNT